MGKQYLACRMAPHMGRSPLGIPHCNFSPCPNWISQWKQPHITEYHVWSSTPTWEKKFYSKANILQNPFIV